MGSVRFAALLILVTLLGLGLRLVRLGDPSLWSDEIFQVRDCLEIANLGYLPTRWGILASGFSTSALAEVGIAGWRGLGLEPAQMRLGSALLGSLAVPLLALACAPWLSRRTALVFALLLATSTWHLEWSQQARHYSAIFLYSNLALALYWLAVRGVSRDGGPRVSTGLLAAAMGVAFVAVVSRGTSLMLFGVIGLDLAVETLRRRKLALPPAALAVLLVCLAACGVVLLQRALSSGPGNAEQEAAFLARQAGHSPLKLVLGNVLRSGIPCVLLAGVGFAVRFREDAREALFLAFLTAVPVVSFAAIAPFTHVEIRYTFVNLFGWIALAAIGGVALYDASRPALSPALATAPLAIALAWGAHSDLVYYESAYGNRPRWNHAYAYVAAHAAPGDAIYGHSSWAGQYYLGSDRVANVDLDFAGLDTLDRDTWFVVKSTAWERDAGRPHWLDGVAELRAAYPTRTSFPQDTVRVYRYTRAARVRTEAGAAGGSAR